MNILFIKYFFVGFMVSEIPRVSVFCYFPLDIYNTCYIYNNNQNLGMTMVNEEALCLSSRLPIGQL